jgi:hypothetical protein
MKLSRYHESMNLTKPLVFIMMLMLLFSSYVASAHGINGCEGDFCMEQQDKHEHGKEVPCAMDQCCAIQHLAEPADHAGAALAAPSAFTYFIPAEQQIASRVVTPLLEPPSSL